MEALGNLVTIAGILVTFMAYFGQRGVTLPSLEPRLASSWFRTKAWILRMFRRPQANRGTLNATLPAVVSTFGGGMAWYPADEEDDLQARVTKIERNLETLRRHTSDARRAEQARVREVTDALDVRVGAVQHQVNLWQEESAEQDLRAMRWEVRGLLIALGGAVLSLLA